MKRIIAVVILLLLCVVRASLINTPSRSIDSESLPSLIGDVNPLLYEVTDSDGDRIWLFGSIHIGYEELYPLPEYVTEAYTQADVLAVEVDINDTSSVLSSYGDTMAQFMYTDGSTIRDHIDEEVLEKAIAILEENLYTTEPLEDFKPYIWSSYLEDILLDSTPFDSELGIDKHFLDLAYEQDKTVVEIESADFQLKLLTGFSDDIQEILLKENIASYENDSAASSYAFLMAVWASGDEKMFSAMLDTEGSSLSEEEQALYEEYNRELVTKRNVTMTDFAQKALEDGDETFICVGAAHVVGDDAMVDLLRERGYTVKLVQ